jgi:hypothetical protein
MQSEREEWIRHLSQESLQQSGKLYRVLLRQIDISRVFVEGFRYLLQTTDITVLSEDTLDSHIYRSAWDHIASLIKLTHLPHRGDDILDDLGYTQL